MPRPNKPAKKSRLAQLLEKPVEKQDPYAITRRQKAVVNRARTGLTFEQKITMAKAKGTPRAKAQPRDKITELSHLGLLWAIKRPGNGKLFRMLRSATRILLQPGNAGRAVDIRPGLTMRLKKTSGRGDRPAQTFFVLTYNYKSLPLRRQKEIQVIFDVEGNVVAGS